MLRPCRSPAIPCRVNSHMPCHTHATPLSCHSMPCPAILRQWRVLRESPRGNRKKPNVGRSPTCRLWTADAYSHMPCPCHAVSWPWEVGFRTAWLWHGTGAAWHMWIKTWPHCVNKMGKTQYKPLAERHGMGAAWERHGMCELAFKTSCTSTIVGGLMLKVQYGDACLSLQQVCEWNKKFMNGVSSVTDCPRPGQAHPVVTQGAISPV
jgi:hypothetical protein